jgi:hypothetical protein
MSDEFTDATKAAIFARDRATCCFSGANLWLLDGSLRTGWQPDWADHIKPRSRGGTAAPENGVCASHTYNTKKRNNTADTVFLFREGHPTSLYYELFGSPPPGVIERFRRLANLKSQDWYFNRAITNILIAFDGKCWKPEYKRTPDDWFKAAHNKLVTFQKLHEKDPALPSLESRKIIDNPTQTQEILLSLRHSESLPALKRTALQLYPAFRADSQIWWKYFSAEDEKSRRKAHETAYRKHGSLSTDVWETLQADFSIRHPTSSSASLSLTSAPPRFD